MLNYTPQKWLRPDLDWGGGVLVLIMGFAVAHKGKNLSVISTVLMPCFLKVL